MIGELCSTKKIATDFSFEAKYFFACFCEDIPKTFVENSSV